MPVNVVHSEEDERHWEEAKRRAAAEGHKKDWKYVMGIYQRMRGGSTEKAVEHRDKEREYGSDETYAWPEKHSYPLTRDGKPSRKRTLAAWRYANQEDNEAPASVRQRIRNFAKEHFGLDLQGHLKSRIAVKAVAPTKKDPEDDVVGPEGSVTPSRSLRLALRAGGAALAELPPEQRSILQQRVDGHPYVRIRFTAADGHRYSATVPVDDEDRPDGKVTVRDERGRTIFEVYRHFGTTADVAEYVWTFLETLGNPRPVYPRMAGAIVGETEGAFSDAELQVRDLNAKDRTAVYLRV